MVKLCSLSSFGLFKRFNRIKSFKRNLNKLNKYFRQIMHTTARVNELKCVSLAKSLKALNHNLKVI